jgi:hypothetical protein
MTLPGDIVSIRERVWAAGPQVGGHDMSADVRAMRNEDNRVSDEAFARRAAEVGSESDSVAAGATLLAHLGL